MYKISTKLIPPKMDEKQIKKISESIRTHRSPDSVIAYLFAKQGSESIPTDDYKIHSAIFNLQKQYPDFFKEFIFSRGDLYPFSKELEGVLFRLQQSGVLGTINPSFERFILPEDRKKIILGHLSDKFSEGDKKKLEEMTSEFERMLSS